MLQSGLKALCFQAAQNPSLRFVENKGQWNANILFKADVPGGSIFFESNTITYLFTDINAVYFHQHGHRAKTAHMHAIKLHFSGSQTPQSVTGTQAFDAYYNFYIGKDPSHWASHVNAFQKIRYQNLYPGIDLEFVAGPQGIKSSFYVAAGADARKIRLHYEGQKSLFVHSDSIHLESDLGYLSEQAPISFQGEQRIRTGFKNEENGIGFDLEAYSTQQPLIIDPQLIFGTFVGSPADNFGFTATYENGGKAYAAGTVYAANFPVTAGAYDVTFAGGSSANFQYARDIIITKFNENGSQMLFATFLGGTDNEQPISMIVNHAGNLVVYGSTASADFPVSANAFQKNLKGKYDVFISIFNSVGTQLLKSTLLGGTADDGISGDDYWPYNGNRSALNYNYADWYRGNVEVDPGDQIYLIGTTQSNTGFPLANPIHSVLGGNQDAFVARFSADLSSLDFCTYYGGAKDDAGYSLVLDNSGNMYIGGGTESSDLPFKINNYNGNIDGFIGYISADYTVVKSSYVGTSSYDQVQFVAIDNDGEVLCCGQSADNMPTVGTVLSFPGSHQFIRVYTKSLATVLRSTNFGGAGNNPMLSISSFTVDHCKRIYLTGWGGNVDQEYNSANDMMSGFPITTDAFQKTTDGSDFYILVYHLDLNYIHYASYYGGYISDEHVDGGTSHLDANFIIYQTICAGCGGLSDLPTTPDAYSRVNPGKRAYNPLYGGCNIALIKFDLNTYKKPPTFKDTCIVLLPGDTLNYVLQMLDENQNNVSFTYDGSLITDAQIRPAIYNVNSVPGKTTATLFWPSTCLDARSDTFVLNIRMLDDACPEPQSGIGKLKVVVRPDLPRTPVPACLQNIDDHTVLIEWDSPLQLKNFKKYIVSKSISGSAYTEFKTVYAGWPTNVFDNTAPNHANTPYCYRIVAQDNCLRLSDTSREICSVQNIDPNQSLILGTQDTLLYCVRTDTLIWKDSVSLFFNNDSIYIDSIYGSLITQKGFQFAHEDKTGKSILHIQWASDCIATPSDTFDLLLRFKDNHCPLSNTAFKRIRIVILAPSMDVNSLLSCPQIIDDKHIRIRLHGLKNDRYIRSVLLTGAKSGLPMNMLYNFACGVQDSFDYVLEIPDGSARSFCLQLIASDVCGFIVDSSRVFCTASPIEAIPELPEVFHVTVTPKQHIQLRWYPSQDSVHFNNYLVFRKSDQEGLFKQLAYINNRLDTVYDDSEVKTDSHVYCYLISSANHCGQMFSPLDTSCSILLTGNTIPFENYMNWTAYRGWENGVASYEVHKEEPGWYVDSIASITGTKVQKYNDQHLNYDNGLYHYSILANERKGHSAWSFSNTIELIQAPIVRVPDAYTPNNDNINDKWRSMPLFVKDFHMQLFNRWGEKLWETHDKHAFFTNEFSSFANAPEQIMSTVFVYSITYTGWDGSSETVSGNVTILK